MLDMKLGSDESGKSVRASLLKCLAADCEYALRLKYLQPSATDSNDHELVQSCNGEPLR
jgi:hypothetical protein